MKRRFVFMQYLKGFLISTLTCVSLNIAAIEVSESEATAIGVDSYIYGYPLVMMEMTRRVMTNVDAPTEMKAPMGQFIHARKYPNASFKDVTAPNVDTLYSVAWVDLTSEPYILHIPDENDRYYLMPILSGWTNVFADPGTRTTGTKEVEYAITGPNWKGTLPVGLKEYKSPTNMVWILGRTYCTGTPEDYRTVHAIQDKYSLKPLSFYGRPFTSPEGKVDPSIDMNTPVRNQVNQMDISSYFNLLALLMKENPPVAEDAPIVGKMARIGIVPGKEFHIKNLDERMASALENVPKLALEEILTQEKVSGKDENGWTITLKTGAYGTDYLQRAFIAAVSLGANLPQDAIYPMAKVDSEGKPFSGQNKYVLSFPKGQIPPTKGAWSLTMYNDKYFFVANPLNRYTLSPRNQLKYNSDGSLDLYIQKESPGKDKESNWLPAPEDKFILMLRLYWPDETVLNGSWVPPAVQRVSN